MNDKNSQPRNTLAIANMVNGLMAQLITSVSATGLNERPAFTTSWKSIFHDRIHHDEEAEGDGN